MPQVTILEGGKPKSFAGVDKLQIALSGGGTSLWVPKDTRLLTSLTANENGTYPPPEGYYGFDTAIVDVPPSQVAGIDPKTGQYIVVGYKKVEGDDPGWATGSEGDGSEDDPWSLDPTDPWDPDTDGGYGWDPWEVPGGGDWEPPSDWPTTENELTQERAPYAIKIVQPPNKTQYTVGETIDYSGIQVQLLDAEGNLFTNSRYPDGLVPFSELSFDPTKAPQGGTFDYYTDGHGMIAKRFDIISRRIKWESWEGTDLDMDGSGSSQPIGYISDSPVGGRADAYISSSDVGNSIYIANYDGSYYISSPAGESVTFTSLVCIKSNKYYMGSYSVGTGQDTSWSSFVPSLVLNSLSEGYPSLTSGIPSSSASPSGTSSSSLVPMGFRATVTWNSPYDGKSYSDTMPLYLTQGGSGGEGIGGGGGGGGF